MGIVRTVIAVAAFVAIAAFGVSAAQDVKEDKGEALQNSACLGCHDMLPIQTAAYDKAGWTMVVDSMVQKGAEVKDADKPALVEFLFRNHGPLPDGPGK